MPFTMSNKQSYVAFRGSSSTIPMAQVLREAADFLVSLGHEYDLINVKGGVIVDETTKQSCYELELYFDDLGELDDRLKESETK